MTIRHYCWALLIVLCSACSRSAPRLDKLADDAVILAFGDSLTYGTGAASGHDYPSVLSRLANRDVINAGVPGEISEEGRQRLPALLDQYQPALLILMHGGNDILRKLPEEQTRANLLAMVDEARRRNIQVVLLGVPRFSLLLLHSAEFYADLAESEGLVCDLDSLPAILSRNELKSDTVHPNDRGYRQLAENLAELLRTQGVI